MSAIRGGVFALATLLWHVAGLLTGPAGFTVLSTAVLAAVLVSLVVAVVAAAPGSRAP